MDKKITTITAFIALEKDGQEGLIAQQIGGKWMPFVASDEARVKQLYGLAKKTGVEFEVIRFSDREDITEQVEALYDLDSYIGISQEHALARAAIVGLETRITKTDGQSHIITRDIKGDRLNFEIEDGLVTSCKIG